MFPNRMEIVAPWKQWVEIIEPHYAKGENGRPPKGIEFKASAGVNGRDTQTGRRKALLEASTYGSTGIILLFLF